MNIDNVGGLDLQFCDDRADLVVEGSINLTPLRQLAVRDGHF